MKSVACDFEQNLLPVIVLSLVIIVSVYVLLLCSCIIKPQTNPIMTSKWGNRAKIVKLSRIGATRMRCKLSAGSTYRCDTHAMNTIIVSTSNPWCKENSVAALEDGALLL